MADISTSEEGSCATATETILESAQPINTVNLFQWKRKSVTDKTLDIATPEQTVTSKLIQNTVAVSTSKGKQILQPEPVDADEWEAFKRYQTEKQKSHSHREEQASLTQTADASVGVQPNLPQASPSKGQKAIDEEGWSEEESDEEPFTLGPCQVNMVHLLSSVHRNSTSQVVNCVEEISVEEEPAICATHKDKGPEDKPTALPIIPKQEQLFDIPTRDMADHLRPLYVLAHIQGVPFAKVMVDGGAAVNVLPSKQLKRLGKTSKDLYKTEYTVSNFAGGITATQGIIPVDVTIGHKTITVAFFVVDTKSSYSALLGRDWIHQAMCIPSTLHQQLAIWDEIQEEWEMVTADARPFLPSADHVDAHYYLDDNAKPFIVSEFDQNGRPIGETARRLIATGLLGSEDDLDRPFLLKRQRTHG